ncbi:MAG: 2-phosphosulfolactate phosphatase [Verrucomicrobiia bacterium]
MIDAALGPSEIERLPERDLSQMTVVVFDVLRATSTMITALAHGCPCVVPVASTEEARVLKEQNPAWLLCGERHGLPLEGFDHGNSPLEFVKSLSEPVILTTTNGTWALERCRHAGKLCVAALLNLDATAALVGSGSDLLLVAAGTFETPALEDIYAAGRLATILHGEKTDSVLAAEAVAKHWGSDPLGCLAAARNGKALLRRGWADQLAWCAQVSRFALAASWEKGMVQAIGG